MKNLIIGGLVVSALSGSYFLFSFEEENKNKPISSHSTVQKNALQAKTVAALPAIYETKQPASVQQKKQIRKYELVKKLKTIIANPIKNLAFLSENLSAVTRCQYCLASIQQTLASNQLSREELADLTAVLTKGSHPEIAKMLLSVTTQKMVESGNNENTDTLISALASFNSPEVAGEFAKTLISPEFDDNLSHGALGDTLRKTINQMTDRQEVGSSLASVYFQTNDTEQREKLLTIQQPESLTQISLTLLNQGEQKAANDILERQLQNNSNFHTADALLKLLRIQQAEYSQNINVNELAANWAGQYAQSDAVKLMENKLVEGNLSEAEKNLVIAMLQNSPDKTGKIVLEKYQSYKN